MFLKQPGNSPVIIQMSGDSEMKILKISNMSSPNSSGFFNGTSMFLEKSSTRLAPCTLADRGRGWGFLVGSFYSKFRNVSIGGPSVLAKSQHSWDAASVLAAQPGTRKRSEVCTSNWFGSREDISWTASAGYSPSLLPPGSSPIKTVKIQVITKLGGARDDGENGAKMTNGPNSLNQSSLYNARVELSLTREKRCN